jgi:hypothetical protein
MVDYNNFWHNDRIPFCVFEWQERELGRVIRSDPGEEGIVVGIE